MRELAAVNAFDEQPGPTSPDLILAHLDSLPALAPIALQVLERTGDPDVDISEIVRLLRNDQSLVAKIMSVAGSAAVAAPSSVNTLEKAVVYLGLRATRSIVLAAKLFEAFPFDDEQDPHSPFDRREFWKHALAVACAAKRLAQRGKMLHVDAEEAYLAGLLHDVGKLAFDTLFPKAYARVVAEAEQTRADIADCESALLGVDHAVAGRELAIRWNLPDYVQEAVWFHHLGAADSLPASVQAPHLITLVKLADTLVREQHIGLSGNHAIYEHSTTLAQRLGLTSADLEAVTAELVEDLAVQLELIDLRHESPADLYRRANAELGRLNAELLTEQRQLTAASRYFHALSHLGDRLGPNSSFGDVLAAIVEAGRAALQAEEMAAFGVREGQSAIDLYRTEDGHPARPGTTRRPDLELRDWLRSPGEYLDLVVARAPEPLRNLLSTEAGVGEGECWLSPIVHDNRVVGGLLFRSGRDERARLRRERGELRIFLGELGLTLGRANAHAAARRLSDDLAEMNRRLQQMQSELLRTRSLSMIAEMASGAGHELNTPLAVISGRAEMLARDLTDAQQRRALEQISEKARTCSQIVTELMDFARPTPPKLAPVDLGVLLEDVRAVWAGRISRGEAGLELTIVPSGGSFTLSADAEQLRAALDEILENAMAAVAEVEQPLIELALRGESGPAPGARGASGVPSGGQEQLHIEIRDNGAGMPTTVRQRAFDPFFSHRPAGRGRGLGLARAHRLIESHGGRVWIESRPDVGTTVHVVLPRGVTPPGSESASGG